MIDQPRSPGRHFTDAARAAGLEARRRKAKTLALKGVPEVFAVHLPSAAKTFSWEIRRFGSVVLQQGVEHFSTAAEARVAGEAAMVTVV
jgi:hypothetical protein